MRNLQRINQKFAARSPVSQNFADHFRQVYTARVKGAALILAGLLLLLAGCSGGRPPAPGQPLAPTAASPTAPPPAAASVETAAPTAPAVQPAEPAQPGAAPAPLEPVGEQLAFLNEGDVWLYDGPGTQPYPLTLAGDILSFAWAPDGSRVATFNGTSLCFTQRDGSVRTACLPLGLDEAQAKIERQILLSPDQRWVVLWNPVNPWDEGAIGWLVLSLDGSEAMYRIEDPVDWGATLAPNNEPGGIAGQPVFLPDGRLLGSLTHRYLNSPEGPHYQLYEFDLANRSFIPFPAQTSTGFSEGLHLALTPDGRQLANYGAFLASCEAYYTAADLYDLQSGERQIFRLEQEAAAGLSFAPDGQQAVLSRVAGCNPAEQTAWNATCGLASGPEVYPLQTWNLAADRRSDLPPGLAPAWSPDGQWIAFQSCLAQSASGGWAPDGQSKTSIFVVSPDNQNLTLIATGRQPQWRP